jgi:hypothetical protein
VIHSPGDQAPEPIEPGLVSALVGDQVMVSGREAGRILRDVLSSDEQARLLLRTGIAGPGTSTPGGTFFDREAVDALRLRPTVDARELTGACPYGLLVVRLPRTSDLHLTRPWRGVADQVCRALAGQRPMTKLTKALVGVRIRAWGPLPFAATFLGYVILVAELTALDEDGPRLRPPGEWATCVEGRRFHTPAGGRPAFVWTPQPWMAAGD